MQHCSFATIERIVEIIDAQKRGITNRELLAICAEYNEFYLVDPHFSHEIAEAALNFLIATKYAKDLLSSNAPAAACADILRPLQKRLPTQTWRSNDQITYQQFSTPVTIAYLAAYLLNLSSNDNVLEPSCGTGSLAVWALAAGAKVITNEIDVTRSELAALLGLNPTGYTAEFIDDLLPENIIPNVVLANPPFSSSGGRTERNDAKFGFRHVESALRRLAQGGRFAVILGPRGSPRTPTGRVFWNSLSPQIQLNGIINLPGKEYYRNGTSVGVTLILGQKVSSSHTGQRGLLKDPLVISPQSVENAFEEALAAGLRFLHPSE